jgi:TetR/AcrR family transcriptional regulator of autoinduction and epiphytic fitness
MKKLIPSRRPAKSPGRPRADESEARIQALLDVAADVFIERGYEGASLDEIARRANASKQTMYVRFPSKANLFEAVVRSQTDEAYLRFSGILNLELPIEDVLEEFGRESIKRVSAERTQRLIRTIIAAVASFPELGKNLWNQVEKNCILPLADYLGEQSKRGVLSKLDPPLAANMFQGLTLGPYLFPLQLGVRLRAPLSDRRAYIEEAVSMFLAVHGAGLKNSTRR